MYGKCQEKIWEKSGNLELNDKWHLCVIWHFNIYEQEIFHAQLG